MQTVDTKQPSLLMNAASRHGATWRRTEDARAPLIVAIVPAAVAIVVTVAALGPVAPAPPAVPAPAPPTGLEPAPPCKESTRAYSCFISSAAERSSSNTSWCSLLVHLPNKS